MATGRLAASDISGATLTTVYECPADTYTVASISICNRGSETSNISLAIADGATPVNGEYIEFETGLLSKNILERLANEEVIIGDGSYVNTLEKRGYVLVRIKSFFIFDNSPSNNKNASFLNSDKGSF